MENDKWGVGDKTDAKPFGTATVGNQEVELIFGEHPHSLRDNNIYARFPSGAIEGFDGHRILIGVNVQMSNYLKDSYYSGSEVRKGGSVTIFADGIQVYEDFCREPERALLKAHSILGQLYEHSSNWLSKRDREALRGRKIYYREVPAVIERLVTDQGCVIITTEDGKPFPLAVWAKEDDDDEIESSIKVEVLSPHIWWFRD